MIYLILISYIILYFYLVRLKENKLLNFIICFFPALVLFILVLALQENVGTDYNSYLTLSNDIFRSESIRKNGEFLFYYLLQLVKFLENPQLIFLFTAIIQMVFLMLICYEIKKMGSKLYLFFFLYFFLSMLFFNQFNGIRQFIAIYIIIYALLKLKNDKRLIYITLLIFASMFHLSALFFLIFVFLHPLLKKEYNTKGISIVLIAFFIISFIDLNTIYNSIFEHISWYSNYIDSQYLDRMSILGILTKIPKLLIVIFAIIFIKKYKYKYNNYLLNLAIVACIFMFLSFTAGVVWRFYNYLDLFIVFPVLYYLEQNKGKFKYFIMAVLIFMLIIKILMNIKIIDTKLGQFIHLIYKITPTFNNVERLGFQNLSKGFEDQEVKYRLNV
jgi:hypothetical protein